MLLPELGDRIGAVRDRIEGAGGDRGRVTLVAVAKGQPSEIVEAAVSLGCHDLGESYADELSRHAALALGRDQGDTVRWHYVGRVQRTTAATIQHPVALWHGVDAEKAAARIARHHPGAAVLVQVNVAGEPTKAGCAWTEVESVVAAATGIGLAVRGLMAIGPTGPPDEARPHFRRLRATADALGLRECSMGMSEDLEVAVQEGATIVRVGTALFGPRPARSEMRR